MPTPAQLILPPAATTPRRRSQWMVISYDVVNDKRRNKVMKALEGHGHRVQYSVFECDLHPDVLDKLCQRLLSLIDPQTDDVRVYPLCENCLGKVRMLGRAERTERAGYVIT